LGKFKTRLPDLTNHQGRGPTAWMVPTGGQGLATAGRAGHPRWIRPSQALLSQMSARPTHVRTWLRMGIDVQHTPLEIKAILIVVPVAVYLVKGPVGKNWSKPWLHVKIGLGNCKVKWCFGQVGLGLAMTLVSRGLGALRVVGWFHLPTRTSAAAPGSGYMASKSPIEIYHFRCSA
jgi:hypothetical protein